MQVRQGQKPVRHTWRSWALRSIERYGMARMLIMQEYLSALLAKATVTNTKFMSSELVGQQWGKAKRFLR